MGSTKPKKYTKRRRTSSRPSTSSKGGYERIDKGKTKVVAKSRKVVRKRLNKALGPYMYYCKVNRKSVQLQNRNLSFGDIGRVLGSQWCDLSDREREKYTRNAQMDRSRYILQMKKYVK